VNECWPTNQNIFQYFCSFNNYNWFWVPILCPFIGGFIGAWTYQLLICPQIDDDSQIEKNGIDEGEKNTSI